jgi:hypothetical protein
MRAIAPPGRHDRVTHQFATACRTGDAAALRHLLWPDAVAICDGGGTMRTSRHPVRGYGDVARFLITLVLGHEEADLTVGQVNGRAGIVLRRGATVVAVASLTVIDERVAAVLIVVNPDKLRSWQQA